MYLAYDDDAFKGIVSLVMVEFDLMGPPFTFDSLLGFVSCYNDVPTFSYIDLSIFWLL